MNYGKEIAEQVIAARNYRNLTQEELAKKCGMRQSSIARIESGKIIPHHTTLKRIAKALELRLEAANFGFNLKSITGSTMWPIEFIQYGF